MVDYVKFIKGSSKAFEQLSNKDGSTLYFITDSESGNLNLYLGNTLISSSIVEPEKLNLKDLLDVTLSNSVLNGSILTFNGTEWIDTSLEIFKNWLDIPTMPEVMTGASETENGKSGLVPIPTIDVRNNFLRGDGTWTDITPIISDAVATVVDEAPEAFDTLKEISDWILDDKTGAAALVKEFGDFKTKVGDLSSLSENQTLVGLVATNAQTIETTQSNLNNLVTKVGDLEASVEVLEGLLKDSEGGTIDLSSYVTKDIFATTVGSLEDINNIKLSNLKTEEKNSLIGAINELHDQLVWGEITINS